MKTSTLLTVAGVGVLGLWLYKRSEARSSVSSVGEITYRVEDLPPPLRALPEPERTRAAVAYYSHDLAMLSSVSGELHEQGYHDAAKQLELRAILVEASISSPTPSEDGEGRFAVTSRS